MDSVIGWQTYPEIQSDSCAVALHTASLLDSGLGATGALPTPGPGTAPVSEPAAICTWLELFLLGGLVARYRVCKQVIVPGTHSMECCGAAVALDFFAVSQRLRLECACRRRPR